MSKQRADEPFTYKKKYLNNIPVLVEQALLNKVAKWEDDFDFPMLQSASLDKKDETESSILIDSPDIAYDFDEADVQGASETSAAKPKGSVEKLFIALFLSCSLCSVPSLT